MDNQYVQGLHALLEQSTANDTVQLKAATAQLNQEYYKNPLCITALATIIASSPNQAIRQLAAVEMRKRVVQNKGDLWLKAAPAAREEIKARLPEIVLAESNKLVRHSTARVIAAIASHELAVNNWDSLLPFLTNNCVSPNAAHREVASFVIFTSLQLFDNWPINSQYELFGNLLRDPESLEVRITAVKCLGLVAQLLDEGDKADVKAFQPLIPGMVQVVGQCIEAGNEPGARALFDVLETLLILEIPILGTYIPQLAEFLLTCGGNRNYDPELRVLSLNALSWTVQYKKSKIQSQNLAPALLEGLMPITTEEEPEDIDDDAPSRSALRLIDGLATNLPPAQVYPALRVLIQRYFSSPEPSSRRGAMLALGVVVEGCSEFMTPLMGEVWPVIETGLRDSDASVRKASCVAVTCLCEWLEDECASKHDVLVPTIMQLVNDPAAQRSACTALDALLEILGDKIEQYLHLIMERLSGLLSSAPISVKSVVVGAIGSAAHASQEKFLPYFQPTMEQFTQFLVLTGEGEEQDLRGIAMDAVGSFSEAVGAAVFRPYFADMMAQAFAGIEMGSARLSECSFLFFGVMAKVFGDEFAPYLPTVVSSLIASLQQPEHGDDFLGAEADLANVFASGDSPDTAIPVDGQQIDVEDINVDIDKMLEVNSNVCVEKEIAADTIGAIVAHTRSHFLPYVEQCTVELLSQLSHYYEGIRKSATDSLLEILRVFYELSGGQEWTPGAVVETPLDPRVAQLVNHVLPQLMDMVESEDNKRVVATVCTGLAETMNKIGPAFVQGKVEEMAKIALDILDQKSLCQQDPDQDENEEAPEDNAEYDSVLISAAGDLAAGLATVLGKDFSGAFPTFYASISKYYKKNRSLSDRSSAIGTLAEIIAGMKGAITPFSETLLELFYRALSDPDPEVQTNACFAAGLLIEHSETDLSAQYLHLLSALRPIFNIPQDAPAPRLNARDNAVGAVARLIKRNVAALPLDQVLPVFFEAMPLKNDYLENRPAFGAIFLLFNTQPQVLGAYLERLLQIFAFVLDPSGPDMVGDEIRAQLISLIGVLNASNPAQIQAAGLSPFVPGA
ncbi:ARM repeat-containing protein [Cristinia sonorae]|uniref:ARM repeat-containing protein n=1 Tax=Cristinia sonorae TaxID=1940300 RepID=A0A8K0XKG2_9AGAR|nr:ARM repeat-containing protein [Cristinia sonorae]